MPTHQDPADALLPSAEPADSAMTTLYRAALGPLGTQRYLPRFTHFDHLGRTRPGWNTAASLCTLSWMALRHLWGPALVYVAAAEGLALLVFGVGRAQLQWPDAVHWGLMAVFGVLALVLPGLYGGPFPRPAPNWSARQVVSSACPAWLHSMCCCSPPPSLPTGFCPRVTRQTSRYPTQPFLCPQWWPRLRTQPLRLCPLQTRW